jgi:hypothetical protein
LEPNMHVQTSSGERNQQNSDLKVSYA